MSVVRSQIKPSTRPVRYRLVSSRSRFTTQETFFASLLIVYEGDMHGKVIVDVLIIKFAHTPWVEPEDDQGELL